MAETKHGAGGRTGRAHPLGRGSAALAGVAAVAAALGLAELVAGLIPAAPSLVVAVGDTVIDSVPGWLEQWAIATLGTADKPVLIGGVLVVSVLIGAGLGVLARRYVVLAAGGIALFATLGVAAALADDRNPVFLTVLVGLLGAVTGIAVLGLLVVGLPRRAVPADADRPAPADPADPGTVPALSPLDRRRFLAVTGGATVLGVLAGIGGSLLSGRERLDQLRAAIRLPVPARQAGPVPPGATLDVPGITPLFTPNAEFYRIDTALRVPTVDPDGWQLEVRGMVDEPFTLTYAELMELPHIEADVTLACVSNEVGGDLVGNARWQGVPLRALLDRAGLQEGATQLIGRSVDGFTAGFPVLTALDVEEAMVAVAMNGEPLPAEHGFPARLVVPGLYGYVSATKWLSAIELTGWDVDGYWIPRGWAKEGPIKTQARIDVPGGAVTAGRRPVAGVAWAPTRGIERVEVRIDDGPWQEAELAEPLDVDCWRQWYLPWEATPGRHRIAARATDGRGEVQTDERTPVAPDGASGYPVIEVVVS
ncbi:DMSO/TMAO reductase YedYZ, molybdopterin-dependent catalytic subunit [Blastococcus sp. DSM 46786]|uniref:molybdopterin-dependent oxidoreductase n=1 Tax=Blastococcus sp. DSM 46786 TaxID=1798227 RepID=UPI0008BCDA82|nr:molybdopterin-dependent oxidoreductase [Blastococcus sp. DSM 46786]SEM14946.1 DMSO/TMAO reductase YedYZ, molybdopterin-dependent catalytic subunit [Blastococcus sp. DSM 46786]